MSKAVKIKQGHQLRVNPSNVNINKYKVLKSLISKYLFDKKAKLQCQTKTVIKDALLSIIPGNQYHHRQRNINSGTPLLI